MPSKQPPMLMRGPLSGRVFVVTRYRVLDPIKNTFAAQEKFDVTEQFNALANENAFATSPASEGKEED